MAMIGIRFDLRVPPFGRATHAELYAACLDQCAWAEAQELDVIVLSEHHGVDDGYLPAPLTLAAAIAGRTRRINITIAAVLVPLHDPVRLAEELAVLDLASGSRVSLVAGAGYRAEEFAMAGVDPKQRGRLLEEYVTVMRRAWTGEPFEWRGRTIRVTPRPQSAPMILVGGSTEKAAKRAARLRCGFFPAVGDQHLADVYQAECARLGFDAGFVSLPGGPGFVHVSEDPERDWARIAPHALYDAQTYDAWQMPGQRSQVHTAARDADELRRSGVYRVVTPEECVALARETGRLVLHPLMGGIAPELAWEGLRLFERKVLPQLR
jgi:alkanesulfonate monooxygenase SsuD/methylene tetrahydromethanopterin reductase-like flavin-dependent oxidoreductase (luciferase family)